MLQVLARHSSLFACANDFNKNKYCFHELHLWPRLYILVRDSQNFVFGEKSIGKESSCVIFMTLYVVFSLAHTLDVYFCLCLSLFLLLSTIVSQACVSIGNGYFKFWDVSIKISGRRFWDIIVIFLVLMGQMVQNHVLMEEEAYQNYLNIFKRKPWEKILQWTKKKLIINIIVIHYHHI